MTLPENPDDAAAYDSSFASLSEGFLVGGGRFTLIRLLGRGGMGVVWLARDEQLGEDVALKFLPPEIRHDAMALDDLRRETARSRKLTHANIIRIYDFYKAEHEAFISMEFVDGPNLADLHVAQPHRVFPWDYLVPIVQQLCEALDYAHSERIVHRDLKPDNMMLDGRGRLKLADFGIATPVASSLSHESTRHAQSGTSAYMSPQQMHGELPQVTDDIYALGATLYELLTSQPPFFTGDIPEQVRTLTPQPIDERLAELKITNPVPPDVAALVMACLAKNPEQRPQSARAVAEWIGVSRATASTPEPAAHVEAPKTSPRKRPPTARVVPVREVPVIEYVAPAAEPEVIEETTVPDEQPQLEPTPGRRTLFPGIAIAVFAVIFASSGWWWFHRHRNAITASSSAETEIPANVETSAADLSATKVLAGHTASITDVKFSPDDRFIVSASRDGTVRVYSAKTGELKWTKGLHSDGIAAIAISSDSQWLAATCGKEVRAMRLVNGEGIVILATHQSAVADIAYSPRGVLVASVDAGGYITLTDSSTRAAVKTWNTQTGGARCVAFSPDGTKLATGGDDQLARVWDTSRGELVKKLTGHRGVVWSVAFSPDGKMFATCGRDRSAHIWDATNWTEVRKIQWRSDANLMTRVVFSPDSRFLASGSPKAVKVYNIETAGRGTDKGVNKHLNIVRAVAFSPDGSRIASGGDDLVVRLAPFNGYKLFKLPEPEWLQVLSLFNGTDLARWNGDNGVWSVQNGVIHGATGRRPPKNSSCLIWSGEVKDFELRFQFRLLSGNSGVFYRAKESSEFGASGYQFDIFTTVTGNLVDVGPERTRRDLYRVDSAEAKRTRPVVTLDSQWHEAVITASGRRITHELDGVKLFEFADDSPRALEAGTIALEASGSTVVDFRELRVRRLPSPSTR